MKNKNIKKTTKTKTGKDLLKLIKKKADRTEKPDIQLPEGDIEVNIFNFWVSLLGHDNFGVKDDFFQTGGNSIKAIQLLSKISSHFKVQLETTDVFLKPTVAELAELVKSKQTEQPDQKLSYAIGNQDRPELIPLSYSQERLYFIDRMEGSVQYHIPAIIRLKGKLNKDALVHALKSIVDRHEILRSVIREENGIGYQVVIDNSKWDLQLEDGTSFGKNEESIRKFIKQLVDAPFDLSEDYMLRAHLIDLGQDEYMMVVILHHIASDGWSISIIVKELVELYESYEEKRDTNLLPLPVQYADYSLWQRKFLKGEVLEKRLAYWKDKLDGSSQLQLPFDFNRPAEQSNDGDYRNFLIDNELVEKLRRLSQDNGATLFMTLHAVFKVLLYRYSGQEDISVGIPIAGRQQLEVEGLIGFFVNSLTIRNNVNGELTFNEFLQQVKSTMLEAYENQEVPFETVVDAMVKGRDVNKNPLFQVMFTLQNVPEVMEMRLGNVFLTNQADVHKTSKFDLTFYTTETENGIEGLAEFCTDLFTGETIERMIGHYLELLHWVTADPHQKIVMLPMLSKAEELQVVEEFNNTSTEYPADKSIIDLFEEQVLNSPNDTALIFEESKLTYKELDEQTNQLANYLRSKGVKEETFVSICMDRSSQLIIGILGIIKAGGAYVPIDPEYPEDRINYMLQDTDASVIITMRDHLKLFNIKDLQADILCIDSDTDYLSEFSQEKPETSVTPGNIAYIMYTSGSTGRPKGVMVEHSNIVSLVKGVEYDTFSKEDILLSTGSPSFDATTYEYWGMLLNGGQLALCSEHRLLDTELLKAEIAKNSVNKMWFISSLFNLIVETDISVFKGLKTILVGGEKLSEKHIKRIREEYPALKIINGYGPTENTTFSITYNITGSENKTTIPIGRPLSNRTAYILDHMLQPVGIGIPGEIYLGGAGLSRGYLNRPELTAEKFIKNPFSKKKGSRLYRTGDLGKWLPDSNIEYLGRTDNQVKVRGHRIELGEIENVMNSLKEVSESCVVINQDPALNGNMTGYYIPVREEVKVREKDLYQKRIDSWNELYEIEYSKSDEVQDLDHEFNIIGWNDSFTGGEIKPEQMRLWLDDISNVILSEKPERVLEIGCGTGLIYYKIAGHIQKYTGIDFSEVSTNQILNQISKDEKKYPPTELKVGFAHEVEIDPKEKVDTIILNSIVQYFPGEQYMTDILAKSISILKGKGKIIVGDVRDDRLLKSFKSRLFLGKSKESLGIQDFIWGAEQEVSREEELCFAPEYFYNLKLQHPEITHIDIQWKQGDYENELTLYRYTVTIYVGIEKEMIEPNWQKWDKETGKENLLKRINAGEEFIPVKDVPNPRLRKEVLLEKGLKEKSVKTVRDLSDYINKPSQESKDVYKIINSATANGYRCRFLLDEDPFKINLLLHKNSIDGFIKQDYNYNIDASKNYASNIPLLRDIYVLLKKEIQESLNEQLPEYMVPTELTALQSFPLSSNGKVDRNFLIKCEEKNQSSSINYHAPVTMIEQKLTAVWQELLGSDRIGVYDNFFEIGGHSLLAMRVVSAIRKEMDFEIAIRDLFLRPTISELASYLELQSKGLLLPPIEVEERPEHIPLSFSQERLWFIDRMEGSIQYHVPVVLRLKGSLNKAALEKTLKQIISRHEALRTVIHEEKGTGFQLIKNEDSWSLQFSGGSMYKDDNKGLQEYLQSLINVPFDLSSDYMMRAHLISINEDEHVLVVTMHHIASDGWSISVIVKELADLYRAFDEGRESKLHPLEIQYADYSIWQRKYLTGNVLEQKLDYWKKKLDGVEPLLLTSDYSRPAVQSINGATTDFKIDKELSGQLQELSQKNGTTLFMTLLTAYKILLYRYTGQEDICVGSPIAGRQQREVEELIGYFINTLALRNNISGELTFTELLNEVRATTMEAYDHQDVPFEKIVEKVVKQRDMSISPVYQVMFALQNTPEVPVLDLGGLDLSQEDYAFNTSKFDVTFFLTEGLNGLNGQVEYCTDLFSQQTIDRMIIHFTELLRSIVHSPNQSIALLPMLTKAEEHQLLIEFNQTETDYPKDKTFLEIFEENAKHNPGNTAIVFEDRELTYKELNDQANRLANHLQSQGVKPETLVPICIERSPEMIIGLLGILKSGAAFVPVDPEYPEDRISYMLEDTGAKIIVSNKENRNKLSASENIEIVELDEDSKDINKQSSDKPDTVVDPQNLSYVIFTSGSTGKPKGVMIEHASLLNLLFSMTDHVEFKADSAFLSVTTFSFDICYLEFFMPLLNGGKLIIASREVALDGYKLSESISKNLPTHIQGTPATWQLLIESGWENQEGLKILVGGEALKEGLKDKLTKLGTAYNLYGPTETTIWSTIEYLNLNERVLIGKPIANTNIRILDNRNGLVPIGVSGEILIGGSGLARGYLNRSELTSEKFIADPFKQDSRVYRTGDTGRWLPDGKIEYISRTDEQVKIRGYRIELGEIESVLLENDLIQQAVVLAKEDKNGNKRLVGYVVSGKDFDREVIVNYLKSKLPDYMIPALWVELEELPLTPNGKINRKALPDPDLSDLVSNEYIAPRNESEEKLASIYQELLDVEQVGINDNFFELGGHSLLAMRVISMIRSELKSEVAIKDIFLHPTIADLSAHIATHRNELLLPPIDVQPRPNLIPLSYSQERLYFIDRMEGSVQYHVPAILQLTGKLNTEALVYALKSIVDRHEVLRSVLREEKGVGYQVINDNSKWELQFEDGSALRKNEDELREFIKQLVDEPFDLSEDYMLRAHLIKLSEDDHILVVILHHIASDGWSISIIVRELVELYESYEEKREANIPELPLQYADYALWQRNYLTGEILDKKLEYWKDKLEGVQQLQLPTDFDRPTDLSNNGDYKSFLIDKDLSEKLQELSQKNGTTLFMTLLAVFKVLMYRYSGQEDICVGSPIAGRQQKETEGLIGFFVNSLSIRSDVQGSLTFTEFLKQLRTTMLEAYEHQEVPFETVVDAMVKERDVNRNPLFQVMFVLQNVPEVMKLRLGKVQLAKHGDVHKTSKFDLTIYTIETSEGIEGLAEYSTDLFTEQTIERMIGHYLELLHSVVNDPDQKLIELPMLNKAEEHQLLEEFNDTAAEYPDDKSLIELFDEQTSKTPDVTALAFNDQELSYKELNERANRLANYLIEKGIKPGSNIGLLSFRGFDMITGMIGILKAGCAYVPFNTDYPAERLHFIIEDCGITHIVFTDKKLLADSGLSGFEFISVNESIESSPASPKIKPTDIDECAYVMFTSGTTGRPKGIAVSHRNIIKLVYDTGEIAIREGDRVLQWSNYSFDGSTYDIYNTLLTGASLYLIKDDWASDVDAMSELIEAKGINVVFMTTALFNTFIDIHPKAFTGMRKILFGGEMVSANHVRKALSILGEDVVTHVYGPTETTVYATSYPINEVKKDDIIPIGRPLSNTSLFVFNPYGKLVPVGVSGELFIGGDGVSMGYVNNPDLTKEKFVPNPYSKLNKNLANRLYRTGDLVRWLPEGNIEYLGREDHQVKIRGYRIELGEIESLMNGLKEVAASCVVITKDQAQTNKLVAYYVPVWEEVKSRESDLYQKHIDNWNELYEIEYGKSDVAEDTDYEFNIIGWNDSFTGKEIPAEFMRQWLDDITEVILKEKPKRVFEIGTGTGLIYYQIADHIEKYIGIDFSEVSMNQIQNQISKREKEYPPTDLTVGFAHEVELYPKEEVDMIILNSIVQYFPGEKYLSDILAKSISMLKGKGTIIVGDVRDNRLLKAFKGRLFIDKSKESLSIQDYNWGVDQEVSFEEELCFSPEYFYNLKAQYPEITHIDIQWKQGDYENELTLYRYTATIYVGIEKEMIEPDWQIWDKETGKKSILEQINAGDNFIAIKDLTNPRLSKEILLEQGLKDKSVKTVRDLSEYINKPSPEKLEETKGIYEIISTAISKGYKCRYLLDEDPMKINLILQKEATDTFIKQEYNYNEQASKNYTSNVPLLRDIYVKIKKDVQESLKVQLPDYMVPSELIALQYFPLNTSGKTDRNFLIKNEETQQGSAKNYKPPVTITEKKLAEIWKELLGVERIGIHDNFFELGGHSLLAMRVISSIRREMEYEIAIKDLFMHPTLAELGLYLDAQSTGLLLPAIEVQERPERIPLSFSQERLWFIDRMEGSQQYHVPALLRLKNKLNIEALTFALRNIVNRHEVLRTVILEDEGTGYQVVREKDKWNLQISDGSKYKDDREGLENYIQSLINAPFDLSSDHMLRAHLIKINELDHILVVVMHHIASDGWSISVTVKELTELYAAFEEKRESKLVPLDIQYADYAIWQRNYLQGELLDKKLEYWKNKLTGVEPLNLPTDFKRPSVQSIRGTSVPFKIDKDLSEQLQELSQQNGATLFMTLLAAFNVLMYRYSGQEDICVGTPIAGRQQTEIEVLIGFFVNTLSLRNQVNGEASFTELLKEVSATTMGAYDHQDVPFEKVVEAVVKKRDISVSPLFQVMFSLQNLPESPELKLGESGLYKEDYTYNTSKFDLTFFMNETPYGLQGSVEYCTDLFEEKTILRMISHYKELLKSIVSDPQQSVGALPMLTGAEEYQLLKEFNDTDAAYPLDKTVINLFEEQAANSPDNTALVFEDQKITYGELNARANQLARYLQSKGVKSETFVPICIERGIDMITGILGILKSGATYVPMDPEYPEERIRYMLEDTAASIVVSSSRSNQTINASDEFKIINLDKVSAEISMLPDDNLNTEIKTDQLAYVIYTSGSTGKPKGVMISYNNLDSFIYWCRDEFKNTDFNIVYGVTSICFDLSLYEIFYPLCTGKPLRILENGLQIGKYLSVDTKVMTNCVPVVVENLLKEKTDLSNVTAMNMAGEPIPLYVQQNLDVERIEVRNLYGPTEDTTYSTNYRLEKDKPLLIGKPIANTQVHILNKEQALNPLGIPGEICLAGLGVTQGYLNKKELTAEKFVKDPFSENGKMYKTGDIGRWLPDGNIEYLGRMDGQIKIRGFRIELGEIESVLQECDLVQQAVVLVKESADGDKRLVGYAVPKGVFKKDEIVKYLKSKLPDFMVPNIWMELDKLPLTPNGKIDRKALPDPDAGDLISNEYIEPRNETESKLSEIWKELIHIDRIGVYDNFFELGGHSLLAMRLISMIRKEFNTELAIKDIFLNSTVAELALSIQTQNKGVSAPALTAVEPKPEFIPLSFSQERIWFIDKLEGSVQYHLPAVLRLKGKLNKKALAYSIQNIINRHESLRTVMKESDGRGYQSVQEKDNWKLKFTDGNKFENDDEGLENFIQEQINAPFDLSKDHMLRANLISISEDDHILVITVHHIAADGWSVSVIVRELVELYKAFEQNADPDLAPLQIQYSDYAIWQRNYLQGEVLDSKLDYWKEKLQGTEPLQMPTDLPRPVIQSTKGSSIEFNIDKELTESLKSLSKEHSTTLFMTLLSAFNVLLYRYSSQESICVGSPIAGRQQEEISDLIGFFVNTLPLRNEIDKDALFTDFLQQVKTTTLEAYEHQDVPFEKIVDAVVKQRNMSRSPLFQVSFMLQNTPDVPELRLGDLTFTEEKPAVSISKFDILFSATERKDGLEVIVEYCTDLYREDTIVRMADHFRELLRSIVISPEQKIGSLKMLTGSEEQQLMVEFNDNARDYPKDKSITDIIEEHALHAPDATALEFEQEKVTYKELNERANQFAHYLLSKGVKPDTLVPLCIERSIEMIVAIFGILKAGAAYVPIDPEYPEERMQFMLEDTAASIIVTSKNIKPLLPVNENIDIIEIDTEYPEISKQSSENLKVKVLPRQLAYVIYTSGSTGKPKGVMIEHGGVINLSMSQTELLWLRPDMKSLQFASLGFDASCYDIFNTLISRGCLVLCHKEDLLSAEGFEDLVNEHKIELATLPSSFQQMIKESLGTIKTIVSAGEALNVEIARYMNSNGVRVINAYGPTELTVCASLTDDPIKENNLVTIGKPNPNQQIYIVDPSLNLCPVGVPGELCVAGAQVARGYLNRPELTSEKFIANPFRKELGATLYRTGDLARWLPDGNIEYLGRIDTQVKVRGFRIELGEIESVLQQNEYVREAVVLAKEAEEGNKRLVGYIVPNGVFEKDAIVNYLKSKLPDYMVPALWVELDSLPVTSSGKIDRKALPDPDVSELLSNEYVAPRNETERILAGIWKDLLHAERVGINDNFFDLGGDSIITIQVLSRARRLGYELKPNDIFIHQTISSLSAAISERLSTAITGEQGLLTGKAGLLPIQQWYFDRAEEEISHIENGSENKINRINHFNQSILLSIDKSVTPEALNLAAEQLTLHHDALRFKYSKASGQWEQEYGEDHGKLVTIDLTSAKKDSLANLIIEHSEKIQQSLDIEKGDIVKFVLMQTPESEEHNRILIVIHHLAIDGVSWRILLEDLELLTTGLMNNKEEKVELGRKTSSYRQWHEALVEYGQSNGLIQQVPYWEQVLKNFEPLSVDKEHTGVIKEKDLGTHVIRLEKDLTEKLLHEVPRVYHTEINDILLCALSLTLCEWGLKNKAIIGLEGHGRENINEDIDTSRTVGWFTNLYPVLLEINQKGDLSAAIRSVKEQLRRLPDKGLGYGVLKYINKDERFKAEADMEIVFNYLGQLDNAISGGKWLSEAGESRGTDFSPEHEVNYKQSINCMVQGGELILNWGYSSLHYDKDTIEDLAERYKTTLESLISHCIEQQKSGPVYTPSDYGLEEDISLEELDQLLNKRI